MMTMTTTTMTMTMTTTMTMTMSERVPFGTTVMWCFYFLFSSRVVRRVSARRERNEEEQNRETQTVELVEEKIKNIHTQVRKGEVSRLLARSLPRSLPRSWL